MTMTVEPDEPPFIQISPTEYVRRETGMRYITRAGQSIEDFLAEIEQDEADAPKRDLVSYTVQRRDRLIDDGITFNGVTYQTRPQDRENVHGASTLAFMAVVAGAQAGDYRWHGGETDFQWIAEDNSRVTMDAQTVIAFGKALAARKSELIFTARAVKDAIAADDITTTQQVDALLA